MFKPLLQAIAISVCAIFMAQPALAITGVSGSIASYTVNVGETVRAELTVQTDLLPGHENPQFLGGLATISAQGHNFAFPIGVTLGQSLVFEGFLSFATAGTYQVDFFAQVIVRSFCVVCGPALTPFDLPLAGTDVALLTVVDPGANIPGVPMPAALPLLVGGLATLGVMTRRRR